MIPQDALVRQHGDMKAKSDTTPYPSPKLPSSSCETGCVSRKTVSAQVEIETRTNLRKLRK